MKNLSSLILVSALASGVMPLARAQSNFTTLYSFANGVPNSLVSWNPGLIGAFVGEGAGGSDCGGIFELQPPASEGGEWSEAALYSFSSATEGACSPAFGPAVGTGGALYGLTTRGGAYGLGTMYMLEPPGSPGGPWAETVQYSFGAPGSNIGPLLGV